MELNQKGLTGSSVCFLHSLCLHSPKAPGPCLRRGTLARHTVVWVVPLRVAGARGKGTGIPSAALGVGIGSGRPNSGRRRSNTAAMETTGAGPARGAD